MSIVPLSVSIDCIGAETLVQFSYEESQSDSKAIKNFSGSISTNPIRYIFDTCVDYYLEDFPNLKSVSFGSFLVRPAFVKIYQENTPKSEACVTINVRNKGPSEFVQKGEDFLYLGFGATLSAVQFYINCEKTFRRLNFLATECSSRNRFDLYSDYIYDLSLVTEMSEYDI